MGIEQFIEKVCVQVAVYWGSPVTTGTGGKTFAYPVEIDCRWENSDKILRSADGQQFVCSAQVLVTQDLDRGGFLMLGTLAELDEIGRLHNRYDAKANPLKVSNAYEIRQFDKTPMIKKTDQFVRRVFI